jgi:hypothetical protein
MAAEFDTVAEWTAEVAADLGSAYHIPAGCRGSGTPAALDWLLATWASPRGKRFLIAARVWVALRPMRCSSERCDRCLWNQRPVPAARCP